jgi:hypothetical protein
METELTKEALKSSKSLPTQNKLNTNAEKKIPTTCIPQSEEIPQYEIISPLLGQDIQYMQDHTLICKFMGLWPSEKALLWWIKTRWKPKGDVSLKLGSKGFFTTIFNLVED